MERIALIPRPTPLAEGGMRLAEDVSARRAGALPEAMRETVVEETVALLAPALRDEEGNWTADYVRLRFIARRDLIAPPFCRVVERAGHDFFSRAS